MLRSAGPNVLGAAFAGLFALACADAGSDLVLVGTVERTEVELVAPVSEAIVKIGAERGENVAAGRLLVELDPTYARVELARAAAALAGARTGQLVARQEHERARHLRTRPGALAAGSRPRAARGRRGARAPARGRGQVAAAARKREADLSLVAPVAGVLDQLPFDAGERVPAGAVLAVLLSDTLPWVRVWVPEESHVRVLPGTPAEIRIDGLERTLTGRVLDVSRDPEFTPHYALTERDRVHLVYETRVQHPRCAARAAARGAGAGAHPRARPHVATARP